jgi:hypothetical protein
MAALHIAIVCALADRRKSVLAANAMYGSTVGLLMNVFEPTGVKVAFADICDLDAMRAAIAEEKPGCILMETISNPLLRVGRWMASPGWRAIAGGAGCRYTSARHGAARSSWAHRVHSLTK